MDFYRGQTAQLIAHDITQGGGLITINDMKKYRSIWRKPVCGEFLKHRICSMPPPSSGGVHLIQILNLLDGQKMKTLGWHHPDSLHHLIESMRIAYADRATHLGDPDFHPVPTRSLTSKAYAQKRIEEMNPEKATPSSEVNAFSNEAMKKFGQHPESPDTSHLTVVDKNRLVISITFTINYPFGSGIVAKGTGVLLNDEMDDFAIAPGVPNAYGLVGGKANSVQPLKTPLSSMTPFVVTHEEKFSMAGGSPGGSTIITTSLQLILNTLVYGMNAAQAIHAPKIHHQWLPDHTDVEPFGLDAATKANLKERGHTLKDRDPWGNANLIIQRKDGILEGCADPRAEGEAIGF
jgi:gamma-glutamyltranspeptidase/glutathione hydrolase